MKSMIERVLAGGERLVGTEVKVRHADASAPGGLRESYWNYVYLPLRDGDGRIVG
jgi:hypothetical protein